MSPSIVPIVEGQSEVKSVPILLRRLLTEAQASDIEVARPFRVKRYGVVREGELERAVRLAVSDRENVGGLVVLLDCDDDCPAELGPSLLERCRQTTSLPVAVVLAKKEFEAWFLGAKESLRGIRGIRGDATAPPRPEDIRGAKEHLAANMLAGRRYLAVDDQPAMAEMMDLAIARERCPSFAKLRRDVNSLVSQLRAADPDARNPST
jgi:hypothetical protein